MKTLSTYIAAAAMAVGAFTFVGCEDSTTTNTKTTSTTPDNRNAGEKVADGVSNGAKEAAATIKGAGEKIGETVKNAGGRFTDDSSAIRHVLGDAVDASLTKDGFNDLEERFVDADRNRLGATKLTDEQKQTLNAKVASLQQAWQSKYGKKFDIDHEDDLFNATFMAIQVSEIPKGAAGADVEVKTKADGTTKVDVDNKTGVDKPTSPAADANKNDPGRNIATVTIAESHGVKELKIPMIHEATIKPGNGWKIDVPDSVGTPELYTNLGAHLDEVLGMKDQWPADVSEGYRAVTHHVLMGVMGVDEKAGGATGKFGGDTAKPAEK